MAFSVIVEPGSYPLHNHGDNAMMQVAVERLRTAWPTSRIRVITACPDRLASLCPSAESLPAEERCAWLSGRSLSGTLTQRLPEHLSSPIRRLEGRLWLTAPVVAAFGAKVKLRFAGARAPSPWAFYKNVMSADLMVLTGMGGINDPFRQSALELLDEVEAVLSNGLPVVAFGQGIGPITDSELKSRAKAVLPKLKLIALRERKWGLPLLESLGVDPEKILITGDDAIEWAHKKRPNAMGEMIGVNVRLARYSTEGQSFLPKLRQTLHSASELLRTRLLPVPISLSEESSDRRAIAELLNGRDGISTNMPEGPDDLLNSIAQCRLVITGSYHAGVFALAQGIPVIGLVQSPYYEQKFSGLADQFGLGCRMIDFRSDIDCQGITQIICEMWNSAESVREPLLKRAVEQIDLSKSAYARVAQMFPEANA